MKYNNTSKAQFNIKTQRHGNFVLYTLCVFVTLCLFCLIGCNDADNYSEPDSEIYGTFVDETTLQPVQMAVPGDAGTGVKIRMYEQDRFYSTDLDYSTTPIEFYASQDGRYRNSWIFSAKYLMTFGNANFYPVDTIKNIQLNGKVKKDIMVMPYSRVHATVVEADTNKVVVKYTISRDRDDYKIQATELYWNVSPYIDNNVSNYKGKLTSDRSTTPDEDLLNVEITEAIDLSTDLQFKLTDIINYPGAYTNRIIIKGNQNLIYVRVGAKTNNTFNFSEMIPVTLSFD